MWRPGPLVGTAEAGGRHVLRWQGLGRGVVSPCSTTAVSLTFCHMPWVYQV